MFDPVFLVFAVLIWLFMVDLLFVLCYSALFYYLFGCFVCCSFGWFVLIAVCCLCCFFFACVMRLISCGI